MSLLAARLIDAVLGPIARSIDLKLDADWLLALPPSLLPGLAAAAISSRRQATVLLNPAVHIV
jgi:hypothetical protein